jgi:hypothetical protein
VAQEAALYDRSASPAVYKNLAAQLLSKREAPPAPAAPARLCAERRAQLLAACSVARSASAVGFFTLALQARAHALFLLWEPPYWWRRLAQNEARRGDTQAGVGGEDECLEEADDDTMVVAALAGEEEGVPRTAESAAAQQHAVQLPPPPASVPRGSPEAAAAAGASAAALPRVADAVRGCVSAFLEAQGGALSPAARARVQRRAVDKVLGRHQGAKDAAFLAREERHVHELCRQYIRRETGDAAV